jgi:acylaminoacyl-peptidase
LIAYTGFDDRYQGYQVTGLYVMNSDGSGSRLVTGAFDRDVQNPVWSADGRRLYFRYDEEGHTYVGYSTLDGEVTRVAEDVGGLSTGRPYSSGQFSLSADGWIAYTHGTADHPADLAVARAGRGATRLTHLNDDLLGQKTLGQVEEIWWESSYDGRRIQGWIMTPPDFDPSRQYPLVLEIHGGPFASYGDYFAAELQLYAAQDYVVLYANPRGSTSYGEEFGNLIHQAYPGYDYDDLMSGVDAVIARGYVDEENLFVTGGSGGGVLSAWIVGKTDRFRAAVVQKPVINWYSFVLYADGPAFFWKYWFPGPPWEHQEHYMARSPISLVGNVTTPTMLITGEEDYRTPMPETEQFYAALQIRGIESAMVRIPDASHGIASRPSNLIAKVQYILAWFEKFRMKRDMSSDGRQ